MAHILLPAHGRWPADVALWHVPLDLASTQIEGESTLSAQERERAARYRQDADRVRFAATRAALRAVLGDCVGEPAHSLRFDLSARGKPALAGLPGRLAQVSFNVSHAGAHALIAVSRTRDVGVDIEAVTQDSGWQDIVGEVCTARERSLLHATAGPRQSARFFRYWTAKEAVLKARGTGIAEDGVLRELEIDEERRECRANHADDAGVLRYTWIDDIAGHIGCLAFNMDC
ncbi:4'-phosphopantetheinyl transferase family protein [Paraburkholderia bannensis]|uniref:4'-phosphopantetheinyl transferase family protein n=1 Tax=Paraburkholderia bannensis TaxID=765414 RepID=UPI002AC34A8C|nr:4'-phosphopantetheinyl transferase superfamily protein [Paraburkholderia bannensis]